MEDGTAFQMSDRRKFVIALLAILLVTIVVYLPALGNGFVEWDDREYVFDNPYIRSIDLQSLRWMFLSYYAANWHPLSWLSLAVDYSIWGLDPRGYHLTNVILHGINTLIVVILAKMLFLAASEKRHLALPFAILTGLLFGLHPIHVESVAWVSERKDLLYTLFYLSSIVFYLKFRMDNFKPGYWLCLLLFILSGLSKPMAISLPLVLMALDYYPLGITRLNRESMVRSIRNKLPLLVIAVALALVTFYVQRQSGAMTTMQMVGFGERLLVAQWALLFYLYKTFVPVGYVFMYLIPPNITFLNPAYSITLVINAFTLVAVYALRHKLPILVVSAIIYLVTLAPVLGIVQVGGQAAADRYMYLTLLVPIILTTSAVIHIREKFVGGQAGKTLFYGALSFVLAILSYLTVSQVYVWRDTVSLATNAIKHHPEHNHAYLKRADAYYQLGKYRGVADDMTRVIEINTNNPTRASTPKHWDYAVRAEAYSRLGMFEEAIRDYSVAIASNRSIPDYFRARAELYELTGQRDLALGDYLRVLSSTPGDVGLHYKVALIQNGMGRHKDAIKHLDTAINLNPNMGMLYFQRALDYKALGDDKSAELDLRKAAGLGVEKARQMLEKP